MENVKPAVANEEHRKLTLGERIGYGLGDFAQNLVFGTIGGFLALYLTTVNAVGAGAAAFIFAFVRFINVFWDPAVGTFVDRHTFKNGSKYRPWLIHAGIPMCILAMMLFTPIQAIRGSVPVAFLTYLILDLFYSLVNIPYGSLNASLTRDPESIDRLTTTRMMCANTGNLLVYTLFPMFVQMAAPAERSLKETGFFGLKLTMGNYTDESAGTAWFTVYAVYMLLGVVALLVSYFKTRERVVATAAQADQVKYSDLFVELKNNRPLRILGVFFMIAFTFMFFLNTTYGFFTQFTVNRSGWMGAIGLIASIPGIVFPVFWPKLKNIFGKKGFFYFFLGMFIVGQLLTWAWSFKGMHDALWLAYLSRFIQQWGLSSATGFMWALVPEVVSYGEAQSGKRNAAIINAIMGLFFKIGFAIGGAAPLWILAACGFDGDSATQSAAAVSGINFTMIWVPIVLAAVAMFFIGRYPLTDADVAKINRRLDESRGISAK